LYQLGARSASDVPDKRRYRRMEIGPNHLSGYATNQAGFVLMSQSLGELKRA
jgi:hypothetical protein